MPYQLVSTILAGGLGKRMSSTKAKVLHEINGKPMIYHVVQKALQIGSERIFIVVGKYKNDIQQALSSLYPHSTFLKFTFIDQPETSINGELCCLGTGDAVRSCLSTFDEYHLSPSTKIIILSGDVPFINSQHLISFSKLTNAIMIANVSDPTGFGRVFTNQHNQLQNIIEHAICDPQQLLCTIVNAGIYNLTYKLLLDTIPRIEINPIKNEFFLTDFYKYTDTPIICYLLPFVPKNVNTLSDLQQLNMQDNL